MPPGDDRNEFGVGELFRGGFGSVPVLDCMQLKILLRLDIRPFYHKYSWAIQ